MFNALYFNRQPAALTLEKVVYIVFGIFWAKAPPAARLTAASDLITEAAEACNDRRDVDWARG